MCRASGTISAWPFALLSQVSCDSERATTECVAGVEDDEDWATAVCSGCAEADVAVAKNDAPAIVTTAVTAVSRVVLRTIGSLMWARGPRHAQRRVDICARPH